MVSESEIEQSENLSEMYFMGKIYFRTRYVFIKTRLTKQKLLGLVFYLF